MTPPLITWSNSFLHTPIILTVSPSLKALNTPWNHFPDKFSLHFHTIFLNKTAVFTGYWVVAQWIFVNICLSPQSLSSRKAWTLSDLVTATSPCLEQHLHVTGTPLFQYVKGSYQSYIDQANSLLTGNKNRRSPIGIAIWTPTGVVHSAPLSRARSRS